MDGRKELDWDLHINVPTQGVRKSVRVTSDESVGALMIKIAEKLGERHFEAEGGYGNGLVLGSRAS